MTNVQGPDFVALQVPDMAAAAAFYENVLGLPRAPQSPPDAVVFATTPIPFAVRKPIGPLQEGNRGNGVSLWFKVDDATTLLSRLEAEGAPIAVPLFEGPFGRTFAFRDPFGYLITVHDGA